MDEDFTYIKPGSITSDPTVASRAAQIMRETGCTSDEALKAVKDADGETEKVVDKQEETMSAERIEIIRSKNYARVVVDGVEIPLHAIQHDGIDVPVDNDDTPRVRLELVARTVDVHNTIEDE